MAFLKPNSIHGGSSSLLVALAAQQPIHSVLTVPFDGSVGEYRHEGPLEVVVKLVHVGGRVLVSGVELSGLCAGDPEGMVTHNL